MSDTVDQTNNPTSPEVENWDDDGDLDFSNVEAGDALQLPSSRRQSTDLLAISANEDTLSIQSDQEKNEECIDEAEDENEEDQGDTLKVSDLNTETLAQLATYAKKKKEGIDKDVEGHKGERLPNLDKEFLENLDDHRSIGNNGDDWNEGLEIPDSFSLRSLKVRHSSSASEIDFETPSQTSASDITSLSITSDHQEDVSADQSFKLARGVEETVDKASEDIEPSIATPIHTLARMYQDGANEKEEEGVDGDFVLPAQMHALHLNATLDQSSSRDDLERQSVISSHPSEDGWDYPPLSKQREKYAKNASESASATSETGNDLTEEDFDDLDFDSLRQDPVDQQHFVGSQEKPISFAQQLQARLNARKSSSNQDKSDKDKDGAESGQRETEITSGLVITDDLDLSPSRLKARNLSSRLREAAHLRRKRQEGRQTQSSFLDHKSKQKAQTDSMADQESILSTSTKASKDRLGVGKIIKRASSPILKSNKRSLGQREGFPESSNPTKSYVGQWTETLANRFSGSRPSTPTRGQIVTGRVAVQQAGSMGYAMPTAASIARLSPSQERDVRSSTESTGPAPKIMRRPRKPRKYGDGKELENIADLPISSPQPSKSDRLAGNKKVKGSKDGSQSDQLGAAHAIESTKSSSKLRKKKQPVLIRNLGGSGSSSKMVGDMRWNPTLKKWEGNEQEGRDFENAIRGTGRPALISNLSFGAVKNLSDPMSPPPVVISSTNLNSALLASPPTITNPSTSLNIVGGMIFDPINLCWVRQDGQEEEDPFETLADEYESDLEKDALSDDRVGIEEDSHNRKLRQRTASAEALRTVRQSDPPTDIPTDHYTDDAAMYHSINQTIRSSVSFEKNKIVEIPGDLKNRIPQVVWNATIVAQRRHEQEMAGFRIRERGPGGRSTPMMMNSPISATSSISPLSRGPNADRQRAQLRNREGPLYLIQSLSRMASKGP